MSERDDELDGKVRRLFPAGAPKGGPTREESAGDEDGPVEEEDAADVSPEGGGAPELSEAPEEEGEDNVVRLAFGRPDAGQSSAAARLKAPDDPRAAAKLALFSRLIEEGMVMVTLDPRMEGVVVPAKFLGQPELRLNFSHTFHLADFDYDSQGVRGSLSFQGKRFFCDIPWGAIDMFYAHETGEAYVFDAPVGDPPT